MARITKDGQRIHFLAGFTQRFLGVPKHLKLEWQTPWRVFSEVSKAESFSKEEWSFTTDSRRQILKFQFSHGLETLLFCLITMCQSQFQWSDDQSSFAFWKEPVRNSFQEFPKPQASFPQRGFSWQPCFRCALDKASLFLDSTKLCRSYRLLPKCYSWIPFVWSSRSSEAESRDSPPFWSITNRVSKFSRVSKGIQVLFLTGVSSHLLFFIVQILSTSTSLVDSILKRFWQLQESFL